MPRSVIQFYAASVECSQANDWEIVQVVFDAIGPTHDDEGRKTPCLLLSANFEFSNRIQVEFHDGSDFVGDSLGKVELWRDRVLAILKGGKEFHITFALPDAAFAELREYLRVLLRTDCFRDQSK